MNKIENSKVVDNKISFGSGSIETDLDVEMLSYLGSKSGYIQLLKIDNPPDSRPPYVVHKYNEGCYLPEDGDRDNPNDYKFYSRGDFAEFNSLNEAKEAFSSSVSINCDLSKLSGVINCGTYSESQKPWFYCKKDQLVKGVDVYSDSE